MAASPDILEHPRAHEAQRHVLTILPNSTYEDFAALPEGTLAQLVDGDLIVSPAPNLRHQSSVARLSARLLVYVEEHGLGAVFESPVDVRLAPHQVVQPDIVFVASERLGLLGTQEIEGAPDLVVEVLSPSTGTYDLTRKRRLYEEHGVREYWIVDPDEETVEVLALTESGYESVRRLRQAGTAASVLLAGFAVEAERLFARPGA